jgi:MFS family permease
LVAENKIDQLYIYIYIYWHWSLKAVEELTSLTANLPGRRIIDTEAAPLPYTMTLDTDNVAISHHVSGRQFRLYNVLMVFAMGLGSVSYGYSAGVISQTLSQPSFISYFKLDKRSDATDIIGLMNSLYQAGGFIGTFCVSFVADKYGRRTGITIPSILNVISGALLAGSVHVAMFIFFRFLSGLAAYWLVSAVPVLMTEIAPPNVRGVLVNVHGALLIFGFALSNWVGFGFYHIDQWRAPFAFQCLPSILLLLIIIKLPESPRWLIMKDRTDEAALILQKLHTPAEAQVEVSQIRHQIAIDRGLESSYWSLLSKPSYRKRTFMTLFLTVGIQMTGPFVVSIFQKLLKSSWKRFSRLMAIQMNNYGPTLYKGLGYDTDKQLVYQLGWITVAFAGALVSLVAIELVSRPAIIAGGILGCAACLTVEAALVAGYATSADDLANPNRTALRAAVSMLFLYIFWFEITLDGGQFVYMGEIFPTHLRAKGISLGMAGLCATNIVWLQVAPLAFETIKWKFYLCFIIPSFLCGITIIWWFPDTKGIPLESIAAIFGDVAEPFDYLSNRSQDIENVEVENLGKMEETKSVHHQENA